MIIDSHVHYSHRKFENSFTYLDYKNGGYVTNESNDICELLVDFDKIGIKYVIEPAIDFDSNKKLIELSKNSNGRVLAAIGLHPTRAINTNLKKRKELNSFSKNKAVVAVGETGLDFHFGRKKQHRIKQIVWFIYQIRLAEKYSLPLILHIRDADKTAISILKANKNKISGGVVHCFNGDIETAQQYLDLGLHIGIGGALLQGENSQRLCNAIKHIPIDRILIETDSPYVLPKTELENTMSKKKLHKICNTSLILPAVIEKIAELKQVDCKYIEDTVYNNTIKLFRIER